MSKNCGICGEEISGGVVCCKGCADAAALIKTMNAEEPFNEGVRLLNLQAARRLVVIPEEGVDVGADRYDEAINILYHEQQRAEQGIGYCRGKSSLKKAIDLAAATLRRERERQSAEFLIDAIGSEAKHIMDILAAEAAGRAAILPEDGEDIDISAYSPEQLKAIIKQNIAQSDMLRCYREKMDDGRLVDIPVNLRYMIKTEDGYICEVTGVSWGVCEPLTFVAVGIGEGHEGKMVEFGADEIGNGIDIIKAEISRCRVCRCTDFHACPGGCHWVEPDLCSAYSAHAAGEKEDPAADK